MKVVVNKCYGGFGLSEQAHAWFGDYIFFGRHDPRLVECVRALGDKANGRYAKLYIVEIPDDVTDWEIDEHDGLEDVIYVLDGKIHRV